MICSILKKHLKKSHSTMNVVVWFVANTLCVCGFQDTRNLGVCFLYKQKKNLPYNKFAFTLKLGQTQLH